MSIHAQPAKRRCWQGLSEEEYTDVLAYLLRQNGYPAGDELTADALEEILIEL